MFMQEDEHEDEHKESEILEMIKKLMEELTGKMEYSSDDFEKRLGRNKKPDVEVSVIKGGIEPSKFGPMSEDMPEDEVMEDDDEDMEDDEDMPSMGGEESLKDRLMRLRRG